MGEGRRGRKGNTLLDIEDPDQAGTQIGIFSPVRGLQYQRGTHPYKEREKKEKISNKGKERRKRK